MIFLISVVLSSKTRDKTDLSLGMLHDIEPLLFTHSWKRNVHSQRNLLEVSDKVGARTFLHSLLELFSLFYLFIFCSESVLIERRPLAGLSWKCYLAEFSPSVLCLSLLSLLFCRKVTVQQLSVLSGFTSRFTCNSFPSVLFAKPTCASWAWRVCVCACLSVHGHVYTWSPVSPPVMLLGRRVPRRFPPSSLLCHGASVAPNVSNLQALIGVMCCRWGNSKHYWTFPALGRRSCGFGPGRVQFGPHSRTLLAQKKESWQKKHPRSNSPSSKQD